MIIKVCGITSISDARAALEAGAEWIGLNLVTGSRAIDLRAATGILDGVDDPSRAVALVHLPESTWPAEILTTLRKHGVRRLQLYGEVDPQTPARIAGQGFESIYVKPVDSVSSLESLESFLAQCSVARPDYLLFDAKVQGELGGTGQRADWAVIGQANRQGRFASWPPVLLAGGLTPANVADAVRQTDPMGVDVCSAVESGPGRKDHAKVRAFIDAARNA